MPSDKQKKETGPVDEALKERERHLRLVFESAKDYAIFTMDPEGIVTSWSAGAECIFGYSAAEMIGANAAVLWTPEDQARNGPAREMGTAVRKGAAEDRRWHQRKDGSCFFASGMLRPMIDEHGKLSGFTKVCRDVTAEWKAEQELAEARAQIAGSLEAERSRLEEIFQRSPSFMATLRGPDHVFDLANEQYYRLVGYREIIGKPVREALPEIGGQGFFKLLDRVYQTGEPFVGKGMRVFVQAERRKDPVERYVDFVYQVTRDRSGAITGIFVQGVDVTERELAELSLRKLAAIVDSSNDVIIGTDLRSTVISWNRGAETILGYTRDEMMGKSIKTIIPPERHHEEDEVIERVSRGEPPGHLETIRLARGGQPLDVSVTISPIEDAAGRVVGASRVARDISDRKRAQEALQRSEALSRELADSMPNIVWAARGDGFTDYFNRRWYDFTGLPEQPDGAENWELALHPEDRQRTRELWQHAVATGNQFETECRVRRAADGTHRWHLVRALPVRGADGEVVRWFGTTTDIDDQKLLQQQNEQLLDSERAARGEAERAGRIKDEFLATLSHELRTPLHSILGWAQILRDSSLDKDILAQGLEVIERNARAQTKIIEDLLDMSRIISGKVRLDVQSTDLRPIVEAALETVKPAAEAKGVRLHSVLDPQARPVRGDPNRLQQVFWNLLSNAVKFTSRGGSVQVLLERVHSHIEVSVIDSGEGIDQEFLPHVFARFRQADATTVRSHGGLGLGLAIVKQLVELHGGTIRVESAGTGKGSTFTVSLPLTPIQTSAVTLLDGERRHPLAPASRLFSINSHLKLDGLKVLVVDDEPDARELVTRLLQDSRAIVRAAGSADDAVAMIEEESPDVLVSDIGMPGEDGYSLIKRVRALEAARGSRAVPAVALTAYARAEDRMKAILAGFQMHLSKPVEGAELLTMIASLGGRTLDPDAPPE